MVAYIFPGQGAQYVGMGKDFYDNSSAARKVFNKADALLGFAISKLCFEGPQDLLARTDKAQLAILVTSVASLEAFRQKNSDIKADFTAGLSLGEYSALVAAGALSFEDSLNLVKKRAGIMRGVSEKNPGKMLAVIGLDAAIIDKLCGEAGIEVANRNCPGQLVVTGRKEDIDKFYALASKEGAKRLIELEVSGAFHSRLMEEARLRLAEELKDIHFKLPSTISVVSNVTARPFSSTDEIRNNLALQVRSSVLWEDSMRYMLSFGVKSFFEIGPGKVLKGLARKIDSGLQVVSIEKMEDINLVAGNH
ncbi:MAG: [acyl-carrier-protein] S-malonyltransferase [Candidatus Omnitrophica bacterium CG11_big_fil_rev_8_21_14_0_20_42_13]|uniref:Malonyl CoA-acyl carrier protein transacylase n=1 Tax=Candidatus Ghiorseimicrobium undicola TaxID=1974746 RepID=A0A2H0LVW4_9BACT|nr:MAG: [acyl-carrier-protein] S-malonyltransferase [Candidatus Omnitrophica bacterium CG11_big_fil_rev_8_21_14_0_20_42_13]